MKKETSKTISTVIIAVFLGAVVLGAYLLSNGFQEEIKTFYLTQNSTMITTSQNELRLMPDQTCRFDCHWVTAEQKPFIVTIAPTSSKAKE